MVRAIAKIFIGSAVAVCAAGPPCPARGPVSLTFTFDGGAQVSPGLNFRFSRITTTVDRSGHSVAINVPRFAASMTLAGAPVWTTVQSTFSQSRMLGAGFDHDGHTPLLVVAQPDTDLVDVYMVAGDAMLLAATLGIGRNRTVMIGASAPDLMRGQIPNKAYDPLAGTVCHGLIVVACTVREPDPVPPFNWRATSTALVVSQDRGLTWQLLFEDLPYDPGHGRGQRWPLQNWWSLDGDDPPLTAYFAATDYLYNPGATGGSAYLFRATRPAVGAPWVLEPATVLYRSRGYTDEHFHTAAVLPFGTAGMRVLIVVGDLQARNRIVSLTRTDRNYTDSAGWQIQEDFHGAAGAGADPGSWANMFTGCAPGPNGSIITGSDLSAEQIIGLEVDATAAPTHPVQKLLYGLEQVDGYERGRVGVIHTPTPEHAGPYVATSDPASTSDPVNRNRIMYSPDGVRWTQVAAPPALSTDVEVHGPHIYMSSGYNSVGLTRLPIPELVTARPLEVGPGGLQLTAEQPLVTVSPWASITPLARGADGRWLLSGVPVDPQPPAAGRVYRVTASRLAPDRGIGRIDLAGPPGIPGGGSTSGPWQSRVWVKNLDRARNARIDFQLRDGNDAPKVFRPTNISSDAWVPVLATGILDLPGGQPPHLSLFSNSFTTPHDADILLATDALIAGAGYPGYPMPMDSPLPINGTPYPDELAAVAGLHCASAWTITFAAQVPLDGWDTTVRSASRWPVATLWGDAANYVELYADSADPFASRLLAQVVRNGQEVGTLHSSNLAWERGTAILVSASDAGDGSGVRISAAIAGLPVEELVPSGGGSLAVQPVEIRFGSHHGQWGTATEVRISPMVWWGGEVREHEALDAARRAEALECLTFLDPSPLIETDGDRICPHHDNCPLVANASQRDANGDGTGDACESGTVLHVSHVPLAGADYATVQEALNHAGGALTTIEVEGVAGPYPENVVIGPGGPIEIRGIDLGAGLPVLDGGDGPAIEILPSAAGREVSIHGFTVSGAVGIRAASSAQFSDLHFDQISQVALDLLAGTQRVTRVSAGAGVVDGLRAAPGTVLKLDSGIFVGLAGRALELGGGATVFNTVVAASARALRIDATGTAELRHVTVVNNGDTGVENLGPTSAVLIKNSIVFGNAAASDISGIPCSQVSWSDLGTPDCSAANGNLNAPPLLDASYRPSNTSPGLDHGPNPATYDGIPPTDADGDLRMRDFDGDLVARLDCGAFERRNPTAPGGIVDLRFSSRSDLVWSPLPGTTRYRPYRGALSTLAVGMSFPCRADLDADLSDGLFRDFENPAAPDGFYYLFGVLSVDGRRDTLGDATGAERSDFAPCP